MRLPFRRMVGDQSGPKGGSSASARVGAHFLAHPRETSVLDERRHCFRLMFDVPIGRLSSARPEDEMTGRSDQLGIPNDDSA